ncbi:MAG: hypothetical protein NUV63_08190 [Gallionella sp.]|nr:hypothetical protein [Gallionella sp.]
MKIPKHREQSLKVLAHLAQWDFPPEVQQRIGALGIVWGVFETNLENTLWALRDEQVVGIRPSTDKTSISQWIDALAEDSPKLNTEEQDVLRSASTAAKDLMEYRHALVHGSLIPFQTIPTFIRNPTWNGEKRKRPTSDAHVDENLLDMAIDATWILCRVVFAAKAACSDARQANTLTALKNEVSRAKSEANELRHLTALMNHEKH